MKLHKLVQQVQVAKQVQVQNLAVVQIFLVKKFHYHLQVAVKQQAQVQQLLNLQLILLHQQQMKHNQKQVQHLKVHQKQQIHQQTAGDATSKGNTDTSATTNDRNNAATAQPTTAEVVKKVSAMAPSQLATNKISITNVRLNKSVVKESDGTDLTINYDWEAKGLHQGDTMVTPMFEGFDSIYKQVNFPIISDGLKIGTLRLDYDQRKIFTTFTADLDPDKIYRGHMEVGTFVSRDYFKNLNNKIVVQIPLPNGTTIEKPLTVIFDKAPSFTDSYEQATKYVMSDDDKTQADVSWAVLINPQGE